MDKIKECTISDRSQKRMRTVLSHLVPTNLRYHEVTCEAVVVGVVGVTMGGVTGVTESSLFLQAPASKASSAKPAAGLIQEVETGWDMAKIEGKRKK